MSVPAPYRQALEGESFNGVMLWEPAQLERQCIEASGMSYIDAFEADLNEYLDPDDDDFQTLALTQLSPAHPAPFDGEGRIVLPDEFRAFADIDAEAILAGVGATFQIWNPNRFEIALTEARANATAARRRLAAKKRGDDEG